MNKVLTFLNGKKLIIGETAVIILMAFQDKLEPNWYNMLMALAILWTGVGAGHKLQKALTNKK